MFNFAKQQAKDPYNFDIGGGSTIPKGKSAATSKPNTNVKTAAQKDGKESRAQKLKQMEPQRFAIKYDPPTIILEYLHGPTGKLYHHKMKLLKLKPDTPSHHALEYLKKKHAMYFLSNKLPEKQLLELISKLIKRLQANKPSNAAKPTSAPSQRPQTASTTLSQSKTSVGKGMSEEDVYNKTLKNNQQFPKQQPILDDEEDEEEDDNYDDEFDEDDEERITEAQYQMIYQQNTYNKLNMNKMTSDELQKHKKAMDKMYQKNSIKPGDPKFQYDVQKSFKPTLDNEWDMEEDDDQDFV